MLLIFTAFSTNVSVDVRVETGARPLVYWSALQLTATSSKAA